MSTPEPRLSPLPGHTGKLSPLSIQVPMDELSELKVKRSSVKGQVTRFSNYLTKFEKIESLSSIQANELTVRLNKFLDLQLTFDSMQTRIEVLNNANLEYELAERDSIEEKLFACIALAQDITKQKSKLQTNDNEHNQSSHSCCNHNQSHIHQPTKSFVISANTTLGPCVICKVSHRLFDCEAYQGLSNNERWQQVVKHKLCHNCLRPGHTTNNCRLGGCRLCKRLHNTSLHKHNTDTQTSLSS